MPRIEDDGGSLWKGLRSSQGLARDYDDDDDDVVIAETSHERYSHWC